jgi:hypothetical protein
VCAREVQHPVAHNSSAEDLEKLAVIRTTEYADVVKS